MVKQVLGVSENTKEPADCIYSHAFVSCICVSSVMTIHAVVIVIVFIHTYALGNVVVQDRKSVV